MSMHASDMLNSEIFGEQPTLEKIKGQIGDIMDQYGERVEKLTSSMLDPTKRAIVDNNLLALEMKMSALEKHHENRIYNILSGTPASVMSEERRGPDTLTA